MIAYVIYGIRFKSWLRSPENVDLITGTRLDSDVEIEDEAPRKRGVWPTIKAFWTE